MVTMINRATMATNTWTSSLPLDQLTDLNVTNEYDYDIIIFSAANHSWPVLLLFPIILCSIVGNILVCLAIGKDPKLQNLTNFFLFSMAMADLMVALLVMPFGLAKDLLGYWPMGHIMCNIWTTMDVFCCTSSILHMCTVSIDRYIAISDPLRHRRQPRTRCGITIKICIVWACAAGLSSPLCIIGFLQPATVINDGLCAVTNIHFMVYGSVVAFFIPLCIVVITYCLTTYTLYKKMKLCEGASKGMESDIQMRDREKMYGSRFIIQTIKKNGFERVSVRDMRCDSSSNESLAHKKDCHLSHASLHSNNSDGSLKRNTQHLSLRRSLSQAGHLGLKKLNTEQRASKTLGLVFIAFVVGWTPFFVANIISALCPDCVIDDTVFIICTWVGWASSMVNPFIYTAFNIRFRQAFIRLLSCNRYYPMLQRNLTPTSPGREPDRNRSGRQKCASYDSALNIKGKSLWTLPEVSR